MQVLAIETILVYKLPHLSREEIKQVLSVYEVKSDIPHPLLFRISI